MSKQFIIRSGSVAADSILPRFNDVFPSLIAPNKRKFLDSFGGPAVALTGRALEIAPSGFSQVWSATSLLAVTGAGSLKPTSTAAGDQRALISTDGSGANGEWGATFVAGTVGAFGLMVRAAAATQETYRVVFRQSGELSLQTINSGGGTANTPATTPLVYETGKTYTLRVTVQGSVIRAYVNGCTDADLLQRAPGRQFAGRRVLLRQRRAVLGIRRR